MKIKSYIFAGIIAAITIGNAMAGKGDPIMSGGENTVTSKSYVDAQDALKQNKIPATGTNASTPGDTVVTYTDTAGTIGERGIYDGTGTMGSDDLITAGAVQGQISGINTNITNISNQMNAQTLESVNVQLPLTCANSCEGLSGDAWKECSVVAGAAGGCTLWEIGSVGIAHKLYSCTAQTVASCPSCGTGTVKRCVDNICTCHAISGPGGICSTNGDCDQSDCTDSVRRCRNGTCESGCTVR